MPISHPNLWRQGTQQWLIAETLEAVNFSRKAAFKALGAQCGSDPLVFRGKREDGSYGPLPADDQLTRLRYRINEVHKAMQEHGWNRVTDDESIEEDPTPKPVPASSVIVRDDQSQRDATEMIGWIQRELRPYCENRSADGKPFDQIGLRPAQNAAKMLTRGITPAAIKHALTLHYPGEVRSALGVTAFDATTFEPRQWGPITVPSDVAKHDGRHKALPYVAALASAGVPIALVGPPGTGKTTRAGHLAAGHYGDRFGMVSMTRGTAPSAFQGRPKVASDGTDALVSALIANGDPKRALEIAEARFAEADVMIALFEQIFTGGGVYLFDEMDAADPSLLLVVNSALANGKFANPTTGKVVTAAPDFVAMAGMNTLGLGGDRKMVAREKQDAAALDRWHAGRVEINLDTDLGSKIFWPIVA